MSVENVEIVKRAVDAFNRRDLDAFMECVTPDIEFTTAMSGTLAGASLLASGRFASVSGGEHNRANGAEAWVGGGLSNNAEGKQSSIFGGKNYKRKAN